MHPHAATATDHLAAAAIIFLTTAVITAGYLLHCWLYPFGNCRRCGGTGKRRAIIGRRSFALCRRCHGDGRRLRIGRHVVNYLRGLHDKADH